jgi:hypothetical protein
MYTEAMDSKSLESGTSPSDARYLGRDESFARSTTRPPDANVLGKSDPAVVTSHAATTPDTHTLT